MDCIKECACNQTLNCHHIIGCSTGNLPYLIRPSFRRKNIKFSQLKNCNLLNIIHKTLKGKYLKVKRFYFQIILVMRVQAFPIETQKILVSFMLHLTPLPILLEALIKRIRIFFLTLKSLESQGRSQNQVVSVP